MPARSLNTKSSTEKYFDLNMEDIHVFIEEASPDSEGEIVSCANHELVEDFFGNTNKASNVEDPSPG